MASVLSYESLVHAVAGAVLDFDFRPGTISRVVSSDFQSLLLQFCLLLHF
ncbi:SLC25A17 isoform 15 [Pan troglodytes]|uniref:SLC25A17 isoform 15 n=1 Tax=Pan troglodytes TaxID=9598 RepID=A0A2J8LN93_PANTR|nr:SLC25A17 isoform 15 [Pan troglodytes]